MSREPIEIYFRSGIKWGANFREDFDFIMAECQLDIKKLNIIDEGDEILRIVFPEDTWFAFIKYRKKATVTLSDGTMLKNVHTVYPERYCDERVKNEAIEQIVNNPNNKIGPFAYIGVAKDGIRSIIHVDRFSPTEVIYMAPTWEQPKEHHVDC